MQTTRRNTYKRALSLKPVDYAEVHLFGGEGRISYCTGFA